MVDGIAYVHGQHFFRGTYWLKQYAKSPHFEHLIWNMMYIVTNSDKFDIF